MQMNAEQIILSRLLPKTGQETQYEYKDDGTVEAGWWKGLKVADNKTRFIAKTINQEDVVIDLATGLMWTASGTAVGCYNGNLVHWAVAIEYCRTLTFAGFTDWRLPNIRELLSIIGYNLNSPAIKQPPFANTYNTVYWTSTTRVADIDQSWAVDFEDGYSRWRVKTSSYRLRAVRGGL